MEATDTVEVTIPAGVDTGSNVRVKGKGQADRMGGPPGRPLHRDPRGRGSRLPPGGPHLRVKVPVTFPEAVLGAKVEVPTLAGGARLKIPPGTPAARSSA